MVEYRDGVRSNFHFDAYDEASPVWRYPDLTAQAAYLGQLVQITIENEMSKEALFLRDMGRARAGVKEHLEGPNADIDTIIRSVRENGWAISNKLRKLFPLLGERTRADAIVQAIREALDPQAGPVIEPEGEGGQPPADRPGD